MREHQVKYQDNNHAIIAKIAIEVTARLTELCISEKGQEACIERYTYHLKQQANFMSRRAKLRTEEKFTHYNPFMLFLGKSELKVHLIELAQQYKINCSQLDLDHG